MLIILFPGHWRRPLPTCVPESPEIPDLPTAQSNCHAISRRNRLPGRAGYA